MLGHPDADALAACREGLLGARRQARIRAHLARCSRCASLDQELAAVSTLLASAPAPRIPDELATRLDTVLAAESAARARGERHTAADSIPAAGGQVPVPAAAAGEPAGTAGEAGPGRGPRPAKPRRAARTTRPRRVTALRAASVTAVLLVIAGGGYGVSRLLQTSGGASSSASSGSSAREHSPGVGAPGSAGAGALSGPGFQPAIKTPAGGLLVVHSGTNYQPGQLVAQASRVLARYRASSAVHAPASAAGSASAVAGCLKLVPGARLSLMDEAHYGGQPATVIVQAPAGRHPGRAWVITPRCSAASPRLVAQTALPGSG